MEKNFRENRIFKESWRTCVVAFSGGYTVLSQSLQDALLNGCNSCRNWMFVSGKEHVFSNVFPGMLLKFHTLR